MKVGFNYYNNLNNRNDVSFKTTCGRVRVMNGVEKATNFTMFNRLNVNPLNLIKLYNHICKFERRPIFHIAGCSDGSTAFDYIMNFQKYRKDVDNACYIPNIIAYDLDSEMIELAKSGKVNLCKSDFLYLRDNKFQTPEYPYLSSETFPVVRPDLINQLLALEKCGSIISDSVKVNDSIRRYIVFKCANLLDEFEKLDKNTPKIIDCCNVLQYLTQEEQIRAVKALNKNNNKLDIIIIGFSDSEDIFKDKILIDPRTSIFYKELLKNDYEEFKELRKNISTVFIKKGSPLREIFNNINH